MPGWRSPCETCSWEAAALKTSNLASFVQTAGDWCNLIATKTIMRRYPTALYHQFYFASASSHSPTSWKTHIFPGSCWTVSRSVRMTYHSFLFLSPVSFWLFASRIWERVSVFCWCHTPRCFLSLPLAHILIPQDSSSADCTHKGLSINPSFGEETFLLCHVSPEDVTSLDPFVSLTCGVKSQVRIYTFT